MPESLTSSGAALAVASGVVTPLILAWFASRSKLSETGAGAQGIFMASLQKELADRTRECADHRAEIDRLETDRTEMRRRHDEEIRTMIEKQAAERELWRTERHALRNENQLLLTENEMLRRRI